MKTLEEEQQVVLDTGSDRVLDVAADFVEMRLSMPA
jgi:hypothetical protein